MVVDEDIVGVLSPDGEGVAERERVDALKLNVERRVAVVDIILNVIFHDSST